MLLLAFISTALAASLARRDPAPATNLPAGWQYSGCTIDSTSYRTLNAAVTYDNSGLTAQSCIAFCASKGYPVAGTEFSAECYCGGTVPQVGADSCNMPCTGDSSQACGGPNRLSVYNNPSAMVSTNPGPPGWSSTGCWQDNVQSRVLGYRANVAGDMTVQKCITACYAAGFNNAGVEYAAECWCGTSVTGGRPGISCNMVCSGNSSEYCGGSANINLYQLTGAASTTTTAAAPTTASSTTTSAASTTTTNATPTCTAYGSHGQISNGGFENGLTGWSTAASSNAVGQARLYRDTPPFEGCGVLTVSPAAGSGLTRYFTITSGTTINPGNTRTVTFYAGRRSSTTGLNTASIDVQIKGSSGPSVSSTQASVCSGASCTLPGSNGSVWQKYTFSFTSNARYQLALQMTVYFGNGAVATDGSDDVLIDYISVV